MVMKALPLSIARKEISEIIRRVQESNEAFVIGRHNKPEAIIIKFPSTFHARLGDITNINAYSASFDFLADEPDLYSAHDIIDK